MAVETRRTFRRFMEANLVDQVRHFKGGMGHPKNLIQVKCYLERHNVDKGNLHVKHQFLCWVRGKITVLARQVGGNPLASEFPDLLSYARDKEAKIQDYFEHFINQIVWCPIFRRNLVEQEESQLLRLLRSLNSTFIKGEGEDLRLWKPSKDGRF